MVYPRLEAHLEIENRGNSPDFTTGNSGKRWITGRFPSQVSLEGTQLPPLEMSRSDRCGCQLLRLDIARNVPVDQLIRGKCPTRAVVGVASGGPNWGNGRSTWVYTNHPKNGWVPSETTTCLASWDANSQGDRGLTHSHINKRLPV